MTTNTGAIGAGLFAKVSRIVDNKIEQAICLNTPEAIEETKTRLLARGTAKKSSESFGVMEFSLKGHESMRLTGFL